MNMNKNKIIFLVIWWVIILLILILVLIWKGSKDPTINSNTPNDFKIWMDNIGRFIKEVKLATKKGINEI